MVHRRSQMLHQRALAPDIQSLRSGADGKDRLSVVECIQQQKFIGGSSSRVRLAAIGNPRLAVALWINIKEAPGQQNSLHLF